MSEVTVAVCTTRGILFKADCLQVFKLMRDESVDLAFADPPFNLGKPYGQDFIDSVGKSAYLAWCREWLNGCVRVLKPGGAIFIYNLPRWNVELASYLMGLPNMLFRNWIAISVKNGFARGDRLYPAHYSLLYFTKGKAAAFNRDRVRVPPPKCRACGVTLADWGGHKGKRHPLGLNLSDVWTDITPVRHARTKSRPFGLNELDSRIPERAILLTTNPGDVVVDPFGGGGGTYRSAEKHQRHWVGSEIADCRPILESFQASGTAFNPSGAVPERLRGVFLGNPPSLGDAQPQARP